LQRAELTTSTPASCWVNWGERILAAEKIEKIFR
jgi:hypothetical protein